MFNSKSKPTRAIYTVRVVYKSGYVHEFPVYSFEITGGSNYEWESADVNNKPVKLGADDIAAIWQVGIAKGSE
jgi:hypothetical protein